MSAPKKIGPSPTPASPGLGPPGVATPPRTSRRAPAFQIEAVGPLVALGPAIRSALRSVGLAPVVDQVAFDSPHRGPSVVPRFAGVEVVSGEELDPVRVRALADALTEPARDHPGTLGELTMALGVCQQVLGSARDGEEAIADWIGCMVELVGELPAGAIIPAVRAWPQEHRWKPKPVELREAAAPEVKRRADLASALRALVDPAPPALPPAAATARAARSKATPEERKAAAARARADGQAPPRRAPKPKPPPRAEDDAVSGALSRVIDRLRVKPPKQGE